MTTTDSLHPDAARALQTYLLEVFERYGLSVAVGLTASGVAIRSRDDRVDATNLSPIVARARNAR